MLKIVGGTAGAQALALLAAPLLARLYRPEDFGTFSIVSAFVIILGTVSALRFELAIPLAESDNHAKALADVGLLSAVVLGGLGTLFVAVFGESMTAAYGQPQLMPWLWFVPATASLMGAYLVFQQLSIRHRRFGALGRRSVLQATGMVASQTACGLGGFQAGGLVVGLTVGHGIGVLSLLPSRALRRSQGYNTLDQLSAVARRYWRFPLLLAPSGMLNVLGLQLPVVLIGYWYGDAIAGWFGMTQRAVALPVTLLGTAVAQVYVAQLAIAARTDGIQARRLFGRASRALVFAALPVLCTLVWAGPWLFETVFGSAWQESGQYARAMALGVVAQMIAAPLSQTLVVFERLGTQLMWDALRVVATALGITAAAWQGASAQTTVWLISAISFAMYGLSWYLSRRAIMCATAQQGGEPLSSGPQEDR